jgi:nucleotidyltransferase substrate binding protein (TIGR01987 family)
VNQPHDIRWKQRFQNFSRGLTLLSQALENGPSALNQLEQEGVVQRFEFTFELAWKTMKDYMEEDGVIITPLTPKQVIKSAYASKIIEDGQCWVNMLNHRNLLSHTYDFSIFEKAVIAIHIHYLPALNGLEHFLSLNLSE